MMPGTSTETGRIAGRDGFASTHWSVILLAGEGESDKAHAALAKLCEAYWYPLYAFARRAGHRPEDAEDLTQGFMAHFLQRGLAARVSPEKGKFRSFLLASFKNYVADQRDRARCQKRGGDQEVVSLDNCASEERYRLEPSEERDPERQYELSWAMALLDQVIGRLEGEFAEVGKQELFAAVRAHLLKDEAGHTYATIAGRLGMTESAVKGTVHRMRQRYQQLFREEVLATLADPVEIDEEMRYLLAVVSR